MFNHRFITNFTKYRFLLAELVKRDLTVKYKDSVLGIFWSFLNPILDALIMVIIFGFFFGSSIPYFAVYVVIGRITFNFFSSGTSGALNSIKSGAGIIKKLYVPKYIYPLSKILSESINLAISMIVLVGAMIVIQCPFSFYNLVAIVPIAILFVFTLGCGLLLASINVFFKDIKYLYSVFIQLLMYASALFYPIDRFPPEMMIVFKLNPLYCAISGFRDTILYQQFPDPGMLLYQLITAIIAFAVGLFVFYKTQDKFVLHL
ncbi:MAG: ABC transporter permease [Methanobrevibacter sp.]|jgi:lipopolysaccharide transport system permease protein|nr:ABC transporter permease [Candidatus Methanoflexus mossambicus]